MSLLIQKPHRIEDRKWLDHLRTERCLFTGHEETEPAHVGNWGKGAKTDDHAIPLSWKLHRIGHQHSEIAMIREWIPDWLLRDCLQLHAQQMYRAWKSKP